MTDIYDRIRHSTFCEMTQREREEAVQIADRILRDCYWTSVRKTATEVIDAVERGDIPDRESLEILMDKKTEVSKWVIYTHLNFQCFLHSDNTNAYELKIEYPTDAERAYYAFRADLASEIDINDLFPDVSGE